MRIFNHITCTCPISSQIHKHNVQRKKDQTEVSQMSKRLFSFFNFQYILIHARKQKLLQGARSHPLHTHCVCWDFFWKQTLRSLGRTMFMRDQHMWKKGWGWKSKSGRNKTNCSAGLTILVNPMRSSETKLAHKRKTALDQNGPVFKFPPQSVTCWRSGLRWGNFPERGIHWAADSYSPLMTKLPSAEPVLSWRVV